MTEPPRVSTIILRTADMERAVAFYRDVLGLRDAGRAGEFSFLAATGITIALRSGDLVAPGDAVEVVFESDDPRRRHAEWLAAGVPFEVGLRPVTSTPTGTLLAAHFRDPDGHLLSLTGWVTE